MCVGASFQTYGGGDAELGRPVGSRPAKSGVLRWFQRSPPNVEIDPAPALSNLGGTLSDLPLPVLTTYLMMIHKGYCLVGG